MACRTFLCGGSADRLNPLGKTLCVDVRGRCILLWQRLVVVLRVAEGKVRHGSPQLNPLQRIFAALLARLGLHEQFFVRFAKVFLGLPFCLVLETEGCASPVGALWPRLI